MLDSDRPRPTRSKSFPVEPLRAKLSDADDRIRLNHWMLPVFVAAPVSIATGLMQSLAISNALGWLGQLFNGQTMRVGSLHLLCLVCGLHPRAWRTL